jgi:hypothetical protein
MVFDNRVKVSINQLILIILFIKGNMKRVVMLKFLRILSLHLNYRSFSHKNTLSDIIKYRLKLIFLWVSCWNILKNGNFVVLPNEFCKKVEKSGLDADILNENIFNIRIPSSIVLNFNFLLYFFKGVFKFFLSFNYLFWRIYS